MYVHTCMHMHTHLPRCHAEVKGQTVLRSGSFSHNVGPRDLSLLSGLASRAFVSWAISLARGEQLKRTDWWEARVQRSDAIGSAPEVRRHAVEELGRAQMFTSWHLGRRGRKRMRHALPKHAAPWPTSWWRSLSSLSTQLSEVVSSRGTRPLMHKTFRRHFLSRSKCGISFGHRLGWAECAQKFSQIF